MTGAVLVAMFSDNLFEMFKLMLMINITMGPCILMAYLWRRTNIVGAWISMGIPILLTIVIPFTVSFIPAVKYNKNLHTEVKPPSIIKTYNAKFQDCKKRRMLIEKWDLLNAEGKALGNRPVKLKEGDSFAQTFSPPSKAIFWTGGIKEAADGTSYGSGRFRPELYIINLCGFELSKNKIATNECISLLFKLIFPFGAILLLGFLTKPVDADSLDRFYGKLLTPVKADHDEDAKEVKMTFDNPRRFDNTKLFPNSNWYFRKWTWADWKGIVISVVAIILISAAMFVLATLGRI